MALAAAVGVMVGGVSGARAATITEFSEGITPGSHPFAIATGSDGNLWFTEPDGGRIGRVTPSGAVTEFASGISANSFPTGIAAGPDGNLWFTEPGINGVGRITPAGEVTEFTAGITADSGPNGIAAGPDGNLWFTEPGINGVGRITPAGEVTEFTAGITADSAPDGIAAGPDGNLWFTQPGINGVGRITPAGEVTEFTAGITADSAPHGITAGPYGSLWFTERNGDRIGRITSAGTVTEFSAGTGGYPLGIAAGPDGNLWFAEGNADAIGRITPTGALTEFTAGITAGGAPNGITVGPDGNLWFAEYRDRVGRITPEDAPPPENAGPSAPAPVTSTGSVSEITATSATVSGTVNARGSLTIAYFEYGTSAAYGSTRPGQTVIGSTTIPVKASLSGLRPATTYHYRLVADSAPGITRGVDRIFTTRPSADGDGDGVPDASDSCRLAAGRRGASGCPPNKFSFVGTAIVKKGFTVLELRVPGPGAVKAQQVRAGRRKRALTNAVQVTATKAGNVELRLTASRSGRELLRRKRAFSATVKVTYTPRGGKPRSAVRRIAIRR